MNDIKFPEFKVNGTGQFNPGQMPAWLFLMLLGGLAAQVATGTSHLAIKGSSLKSSDHSTGSNSIAIWHDATCPV